MILSLIARLLHQSHRFEERIMAKIDDLSAAVEALIADQQAFIADVHTEIATLMANTGSQMQFDSLLAKLAAAKTALDAADVAAKTPAEPVTPPAP